MDDFTTGRIRINDVWFPCVADVGYTNLASWVNSKATFGDYTRESDDIISSKIWTSYVNGIGIDRIREGSDEAAFWFGNAWTRTPYQLTLAPKTNIIEGVRYPLGDLNGIFYATDSDSVYPVDTVDRTAGSALGGSLLPAPPHYKAVSFKGKQYIPLGVDGYAHHDGSTVTVVTSSIDVIQFLVWDATDPSLAALTPTGQLYMSDDGVNWGGAVVTINSSYTPRHLVHYVDRQENECIYIIHTAGCIAYDPLTGNGIPTRLTYPPHPDNGRGATMWRNGEDMFITAGIGVYRFNLAAISPVGLDRDDGLVSTYRGYINDLEPEHNAMYAYVKGEESTPASEPEMLFDDGYLSESLDMTGTVANSMVVAFNGFGWHPVWESPNNEGEVNWIVVSAADENYSIWWGWGDSADGDIYGQTLPRSFANPRQLMEVGDSTYEATGYVDLGWFDANMQEFDKIGSHVEVRLTEGDFDNFVTVKYQVDYDPVWYTLGVANAEGNNRIAFGIETLEDGTIFSRGLSFSRIRFRLELTRGSDETISPMVDSFVLKYRKIPLKTETFNITITLMDDQFMNDSPLDLKAELDAFMTTHEMVRFQLSERTEHSFRGSITQIRGVDMAGLDYRGSRTITIVAIPLEGYDGRSSG